MTRREKVLTALQSLTREATWGLPSPARDRGFTTGEVALKAGIVRSNCSAELNELVRAGLVEKTPGRPALYRPTWKDLRVASARGAPRRASVPALLAELPAQSMQERLAAASRSGADDFDWGVATQRSLHDAVQQAKMALTYPPHGMHMLLLGETGVGKSTFSRKMHEYAVSHGVLQQSAPFVAFNCSEYANNPEILLDQLFGHARGAYTGAHSDKQGLVEQANGGMLFLDEVHRLPPQGQEMLFHLLDYGVYRRLGETAVERRVRILLVAATTETPESVLLSTFRRRIPVVIHLPALRDWTLHDRYELVYALSREEARLLGRPVKIAARALDILLFARFEANIGDLKNVLKLACARAFQASVGPTIDVLAQHVLTQSDERSDVVLGRLVQSTDLVVEPAATDPPPLPMLDEGSRYAKLGRLSQTLYELGFDSEEILESLARELHGQDQTRSHEVATVADLREIVGEPLFSTITRAWRLIESGLQEGEREVALLRVAVHLSGVIRSNRPYDESTADGLDEVVRRVQSDFPVLYQMAGRLLKTLADQGVLLPAYETAIVALLLRPQEGADAPPIGVVVAMYGDGIARQLVESARRLTEGHRPIALDLSFQTPLEVMDERLTQAVTEADTGRGVVVFTDIPRFAPGGGWSPPPLHSVACVWRPDLRSVVQAVQAARSNVMTAEELAAWLRRQDTASRGEVGRRVVWGCCMTGKGTARAVVRLIRDALPPDLASLVEVLPKELGHGDAWVVPDEGLVATVGSVNPNIPGIPFFSVENLLTKDGLDRLLNVLYMGHTAAQSSAPPAQAGSAPAAPATHETGSLHTLDAKDSAAPGTDSRFSDMEAYVLRLLRHDLVFLNPELGWQVSKQAWQRIEAALERTSGRADVAEETVIRFCLHLAYAIERMVRKADMLHPYPQEIALRYPAEWRLMEEAWQPISDVFRLPVNDHELAYLVELVFANRSLEVSDV